MKNFQITLLNSGTLDIVEKENAILCTNDNAAKYGLSLTPDEAHRLTRYNAGEHKSHGRLEIGQGILPKIIRAVGRSLLYYQRGHSGPYQRRLHHRASGRCSGPRIDKCRRYPDGSTN